MGTHLSFSTAFHPQSSGQVERVNQILEDMLRASVISFGMGWENCLPFAEFAYNNSYQASLGKAPFEVLYGRKCRTPLNWSETGERQLFGPDMIQEAEEQVCVIREKLKRGFTQARLIAVVVSEFGKWKALLPVHSERDNRGSKHVF